MSSKPTSAKSLPSLIFSSLSASMTQIVVMLLAVNNASGGLREANSFDSAGFVDACFGAVPLLHRWEFSVPQRIPVAGDALFDGQQVGVDCDAGNSLVAVLYEVIYGEASPCSVFNFNGVCSCYLDRPVNGDYRRSSGDQGFEIGLPAIRRDEQNAICSEGRHHLDMGGFDGRIFA